MITQHKIETEKFEKSTFNHKGSAMLKFQGSMGNGVVRGQWDIDPHIYTSQNKKHL